MLADALTFCVPAGDSSVNGLPLRRVTVVVFAPISMSNVRPRQCSPLSVTPSDSCGGSIGSRWMRSSRQRNPVRPNVKTCEKPPEPVRKL
jgi:hypothetical protein